MRNDVHVQLFYEDVSQEATWGKQTDLVHARW